MVSLGLMRTVIRSTAEIYVHISCVFCESNIIVMVYHFREHDSYRKNHANGEVFTRDRATGDSRIQLAHGMPRTNSFTHSCLSTAQAMDIDAGITD